MKSATATVCDFEEALSQQDNNTYLLRLYVSGASPNSMQAITNIKRICQQYLAGRHQLDVVDVYQQPQLAAQEQVVAAPMLVKKLPLPLRRLIGDLSNTKQALYSLGLTS